MDATPATLAGVTAGDRVGAPDVSTPALVLTVHDHNGLNQVRTLGRMGVAVAITHPPGRSAASYTRYAARRFSWDVHARRDEETLRFLLDEVSPALGRPAVLLPGEDRSAIFIAEHAATLGDRFLPATGPGGLVRTLVDKGGLMELCRRTGTHTPRTAVLANGDEAERFARAATLPLVVKARHGWRLNGLSDAVTAIVDSVEECVAAVERLTLGGTAGVAVQEYVPGGPDAVWLVNGYAGEDGRPRLMVSANKLREYPVDRGLTTLGVARPNPAVTDAAARFIEQIGYRGLFDMEFRHDARDGSYGLIDFNPRAGANFRLCVDVNELDSVRAAYLDLTGQPVDAGPPRTGRRWMVENWDLVSARRYIGDGRISLREYLRSVRGVEERAWAASDDPAPFAMMLAELARFTARYAGSRAARALSRR
jgi:predicted ATP-grasp superfamily ATP-dependent carboligase